MAEDVLLAQINALDENLKRINVLLLSQKIEAIYRNAIYGKFARAISPQRTELQTLKGLVEKGGLNQAQRVEAWHKYASIKQESQRIFAQCLDFLGGIAVRTMELEEGICDLAEGLVQHYAGVTGLSWSSVMILGEDRLFDVVARITQIIRMRFPEWDIWSLPFTAYEFGQLVAGSEFTSEFFVDAERGVRRLIVDEKVTDRELQAVPEDIVKRRKQYQDLESRSAEEVDSFLEQQRIHMRSLFADVFATYFLGPAYICARLYLRLIPTEIFQDRPQKPSRARRMAYMLWTLEEMNKAEKPDPFEPGPYEGELNRFKTVWTSTVQAVDPTYRGDFSFGKPYDDWFPEMFTILQRAYREVGFRRDNWATARDIGEKLLDSAEVAPDTSPIVLLNAAWVCRIRNPDRLSDIVNQVRPHCEKLIPARRPGPPPQA